MFTFCTNANCNRVLSDFELNKITKSVTGKFSKYKFCVMCRRKLHTVRLLNCVQCREIFDPFVVDENGRYNKGTILKMFCYDCSVENEKARQRAKWHRNKEQYKLNQEAKKIAL